MPSTANSTRRRINRDWKQWQLALRVLRKTRRKVAKEYSPHGPKWTHNMLLHWDGKIDDLLKTEPPKYTD